MEQNKKSIELINSKNTKLLVDFIQNLKDENGNTIPEFKNLSTDNEDIKDIIVIVVNYFKQDTYKPLRYNNHEITNISSFNKAMEENIKVNEISENIINVFKLMFLFYEKIYNKNKINEDTLDIYDHYVLRSSIATQYFFTDYLLENNIDDTTLQYIISELVRQQKDNSNNIFYIVSTFVKSYLTKKNYTDICDVITILITQNKDKIPEIIQGLVEGYLLTEYISYKPQEIIVELITQNKDKIPEIIQGLVEGCLLTEYIPYKFKKTIVEFIKQIKEEIPEIIQGLVKSRLSEDNFWYEDLQEIIVELIEENENKIPEIIQGLVKSCLSEGDISYKFQEIIIEFIKQNKDKIPEIIDSLVKSCLSEGDISYKFQETIVKLVAKNENKIPEIIDSLVKSCLSEGDIGCEELQDIIIELVKENKENSDNIFEIIDSFISYYLLEGKDISYIKSFFIKASQQGNTSIDIIYNFIYTCVFREEYQLDSENIVHLIEIIEDENNEKKEESKSILCGMYVSDYLLKLHNKKRNESIQLPDVQEEFKRLLNDVLNRNKDNKIKRIEDLTIKEIKLLFNSLMNIRFNKTKEGVNNNNINTGPFLQIITSLAKNSGVDENTTIDKLFNEINQKDLAINNCQNKLNNFGYAEIENDTKINSIEDFVINILNLKSEDFGKDGFKTFYVEFPGHAVTIVIDTSKSYEEFIENNKGTLKDIIMIDSSKYIRLKLIKLYSTYLHYITRDLIKEIPVPNINYQKNETCWGNATCANSALLNNYESFDKIVKRNEKGEIVGLQDGVQENIINEASKYYVSNTDIELDKNKYYDVKQTNVVAQEFRNDLNRSIGTANNTVTNNNKYSIKSNVKQEQLFQKPIEVFKAQQFELKNKQPTQEEEKLKEEKEKLKEQLEKEEISIEDFNKKYEEHKKKKAEFKKIKKRLDLIVEKKLEYVPTFGGQEVENFRCYSNSKHANDTILSFDIHMKGNEKKKVSVKFLLKDTDIMKVDDKFIKEWEEKIKINGLDNVVDNVKVKMEGLNSYVSLKNSHHKQQICGMVKNDINLHRQF